MISLKFKSLVMVSALALGSITFGGTTVSAATLISTGSCANNDLSAPADDCFGMVFEVDELGEIVTKPNGDPININDSADGSGQKISLNGDTFVTADTPPVTTVGIFDINDWVEIAKSDDASNDYGLTAGSGGSGNWSITTGNLSVFDNVMIVLKAANSFSAYLYEDSLQPGTGGTFSTASMVNGGSNQPGLSHLTIYASGSAVDDCNPFVDICDPPVTEVVPLPAGMVLMMSALGLSGLVARRRRNA